MGTHKLWKVILPTGIAAAILFGGWWTYSSWKDRFFAGGESSPAEEAGHAAHGGQDRIRLSSQARANLGLTVKPVTLQTHRRSIHIPGVIVERPDRGDRGITSPFAGVIRQIAVVPGDTVQPGDELFTVRLLSETLQSSQSQLYKSILDLGINEKERKRYADEPEGERLFKARLIELGYEKERLRATLDVLQQELLARGLTEADIAQIKKGKFLTEIKIAVPPDDSRRAGTVAGVVPVTSPVNPGAPGSQPTYEVEELKVKLGEQVQAGQLLGQLMNHESLYIEGRGFEEDMTFLERATQQGWTLHAEFIEEAGSNWPPFGEELKILHLGTKVDPTSRTFPFYVSLTNHYREREGSRGRTARLWRFRPGQRVSLGVPAEEFQNVFVLPAEAVAREGPEAYVFRANGDLFHRKPVHVLWEDARNVLIANDGSISEGNLIAQNGAVQLNRALKAQAAGGAHDPHAGHMH